LVAELDDLFGDLRLILIFFYHLIITVMLLVIGLLKVPTGSFCILITLAQCLHVVAIMKTCHMPDSTLVCWPI